MWARYSSGYRGMLQSQAAFKTLYAGLHKNPFKYQLVIKAQANGSLICNNEAVIRLPKILNRRKSNVSYCKWLKSKEICESQPATCSFQQNTTKPNQNLPEISPEAYHTTSLNHQISVYLHSSALFTSNNIFGISSNSQSYYNHVRYAHTHRVSPIRKKRPANSELEEDDPFSVGDEPANSFGSKYDKIGSRQHRSSFEENFKTFGAGKDFYEDFNKKKSQIPDEEKEDISSTKDLPSHEHDRIAKLFPIPKSTLNNIQQQFHPEKKMFEFTFKPAVKSHVKTKKLPPKSITWICTLRLQWPEPVQFEESAVTKQLASNKAAYKALHWLYTNNRIDNQGLLVHSSEDIRTIKKDLNKPFEMELDDKAVVGAEDLIAVYNVKIEPLIKEAKEKLVKAKRIPLSTGEMSITEIEEEAEDYANPMQNIHNLKLSTEREYADKIFGIPSEAKDQEKMHARNEWLLERSQRSPEEIKLPISEYKEQILNTITSNRALVIRGAPGCGKSTQVPHYILQSLSLQGVGAECNVLVSEPRRVAALSLAERVAEQRGEETGEAVGYQVRLSTRMPRALGGTIVYCTAGSLLRRLATSPDLPGCSHLVLDEAHERSADSDAVMALAKRAMTLNPRLKIIVMSATIDTQLFSQYFGGCPILDIPGFTFPVKSYFIDEIMSNKLHLPRSLESSKREDSRARVDSNELSEVIRWVDRVKPEGAILCFLPGWSEIRKLNDILITAFQGSASHLIVPVHSKLSNADQQKIFSKPGSGVRKIILATNIAETSITIDDVVYVIDSGIHKEQRMMTDKGIASLDAEWVSKANVTQRKGRAGRVMAGECFHLYTREKMETFAENPTPEILRVPLEKTVLDCKTYSEKDKALEFLQQFPQPPTREAIEMAVQDLIDLGALDKRENLTPLGRRIASFTTHPKLSKALIHSTIFQVTSPIVTLATILSNNIELFVGSVYEKEAVRKIKQQYHPTSDHQAIHWISERYHDIHTSRGFREAYKFCTNNYIRKERIGSVANLRKICIEHLKQAKMVPPLDYHNGADFPVEDTYASVDELVKGVLLSGLNTIIHTKYTVKTKGKLSKAKDVYTDKGQRAFIATDSINHKIHKQSSPGLLLHCGAVHSQERRGVLVRDTSLLAPITAFLFTSKVKKVFQNTEYAVFELEDKRIKIKCPPEHAKILEDIRNILWETVQYYIENKGFEENNNAYSLRRYRNYNDKEDMSSVPSAAIDKFKDNLVKFIATILNNAEIIEEGEEEKDDNKSKSLYDHDY